MNHHKNLCQRHDSHPREYVLYKECDVLFRQQIMLGRKGEADAK